MNWMTKSAAMLVAESGSRMSLKKRIGPAPSIRAASTSSSGTVRKNWRKRKVAVAEAISGGLARALELPMPEIVLMDLDAELARVELSEGLAGKSPDREKAKARVNRLMREVDKCIALLGRPE